VATLSDLSRRSTAAAMFDQFDLVGGKAHFHGVFMAVGAPLVQSQGLCGE
jgi:hypothetical protein